MSTYQGGLLLFALIPLVLLLLSSRLWSKGRLPEYNANDSTFEKTTPSSLLRLTPSRFRAVSKPVQRLVDESKKSEHSLASRHALAIDTDKSRPLLPGNFIGRHFGLPRVHKEQAFHLLGDHYLLDRVRKWGDKTCRLRNNSAIVKEMSQLPTVSDPYVLVQRSFIMTNVGYVDDVEKPIFPTDGEIFQRPFCDLRKCDQLKFPFIYIVIAHRNRLDNLSRFIQTLRNTLLECRDIPKWLNCLCIYVSDYDSNPSDDVLSRLSSIWNRHIRVLSRQQVTSSFSRGLTFNSALRYVPTPANRSLIYFMDADLEVMDASVITNALRGVKLGSSISFPIHMRTTSKVKDVITLYDRLLNGTIWGKSYSVQGTHSAGMVCFYLYDNPIGYCGKTAFRTQYGKEDIAQFNQFKDLQRRNDDGFKVLRETEPYLWHTFHTKKFNWLESRDGIT